MLLNILADFSKEDGAVIFVGDSVRDIEAAIAAKVQPVLVRTGNGHACYKEAQSLGAVVFDDLQAVVSALLASGQEAFLT